MILVKPIRKVVPIYNDSTLKVRRRADSQEVLYLVNLTIILLVKKCPQE